MRIWNPKILIAVVALFLSTNLCEAADTRAIIRVKARAADGATRDISLYSGYYALVVGCGDYRRGWPRLPNPVKDAREVARLLRSIGWKVDLLEDPDWATLRRGLNAVVVGPGKEKDRAVLFWFSGHGHTLKEAGGKKLGYIVPVDAPNPDRDELGFMEHAISMRAIETIAKRIQARHVIMLFDSCFSGAIFQAVRSKPSPYIEEKVKKSVRQFVTAGTEDEQVPDQSVFKVVFVQAVKDGYADRNKDGYVTGMELGDYLQEQVVNYSRKAQHPQFGKINDPQLDKGDFVFALKAPSSEEPGGTDLKEEKARLERERQEVERMKAEIEREKLKAERERLEEEKRKLERRKQPAGPGPTKVASTGMGGRTKAVHDFVQRFLMVAERRDVEGLLTFYADRVDYFGIGVVTKNKIRKDKRYYYKRWPSIDYELVGDIQFLGSPDDTTFGVVFDLKFLVKDSRRWISGKARNTLRLREQGGSLVIVDEKQKVLHREKGNL